VHEHLAGVVEAAGHEAGLRVDAVGELVEHALRRRGVDAPQLGHLDRQDLDLGRGHVAEDLRRALRPEGDEGDGSLVTTVHRREDGGRPALQLGPHG